jgi:hypothetical protein
VGWNQAAYRCIIIWGISNNEDASQITYGHICISKGKTGGAD